MMMFMSIVVVVVIIIIIVIMILPGPLGVRQSTGFPVCPPAGRTRPRGPLAERSSRIAYFFGWDPLPGSKEGALNVVSDGIAPRPSGRERPELAPLACSAPARGGHAEASTHAGRRSGARIGSFFVFEDPGLWGFDSGLLLSMRGGIPDTKGIPQKGRLGHSLV